VTEYYGETDTEIGMTLDEYQDLAIESAIYDPAFSILYPALKLAGEAGEVSEKIGKRLRDYEGDFTDPEWQDSVAKELGDVLWYIAALARDIGWTLEEVAEANLSKLASRMERGVIAGSGDDR
jgi:NTP pyrophosphatase (non-canonical NTP hydrolase)